MIGVIYDFSLPVITIRGVKTLDTDPQLYINPCHFLPISCFTIQA